MSSKKPSFMAWLTERFGEPEFRRGPEVQVQRPRSGARPVANTSARSPARDSFASPTMNDSSQSWSSSCDSGGSSGDGGGGCGGGGD